MGASSKIKKVLKSKNMTQFDFSDIIDTDPQQVRNALYRDAFTYAKLESWMDAIGVDIVLKDRGTGEIYE